ncbi:hypothetical protein PHSY_006933 [Pseudozyma hubeiensis SY62]|uniref:Uncharacterized protein n=1 Tax=Pseudozyma hubeiensis (strain SY62) TaxID=1305764 RepID=R9PDN9_PSEHS|nr:hypothetical protein PHSY_006933 [Pseudozyma hubeiensis SY62]GAC99332.1 hypothetical protein PHSY_006933 [Pseudozyma hubeiensis SY62]
MSARDVDLEFERAYQRLFARSTPTETETSNAARRSGDSSESQAGSSKDLHAVDNGLRPGPPASSTSRTESKPPRNIDASLLSLARQTSINKARSQARDRRPSQDLPPQRQEQTRPKVVQSPLDALALHKTASSSKGKRRAYSHPETEDRHAGSAERVAPPLGPAQAQPGSMSYQGPVAYYPYPASQPSYQVSSSLMAPAHSMAHVPGQAIAWTQPIMSTGPMPGIAYPGFSASVTFSQPQFFASPPHALPSAVSAPPSNGWSRSQQQESQRGASTATFHDQHDQLHLDTALSSSRRRLPASSPRKDAAAKMRDRGAIAQLDSKAHIRNGFREPAHWEMVRQKALKKQKRKQKKELLDENGMLIPRKRGRPPRIRELSPQDATPEGSAMVGPGHIKAETVDAGAPHVDMPVPSFEACLRLPADRGCPYNKETHTLFIHSARKLRWLARIAIAQTDQRTSLPYRAERSAAERIEWARWSASIAAPVEARIPQDTPATCDSGSASQVQSQSQSDPAGLFPRDKRRDYVALRKELHAAKRVASARICVSNLVRYLARTSRKAEGIKWNRRKREYLDRKHRAAKLAKYMLKSVRPTALDVRRMWSVWARAAHARSSGNDAGGSAAAAAPQRNRRVSFAAALKLESPEPASVAAVNVDEGMRVKIEPESPSAQRTKLVPALLCSSDPVQVKSEPGLDGVMTLELPATPVAGSDLGAISSALHTLAGAGDCRRTRSPLFLRRNFRVYRLVGLSDLPLS